ncbi:hypothetical protein AAFF_G00379040 [Aldrovandia affinis]|uniref:Uncharacterized protein n=1 Tax=Aldrovandia affinis TaxID=143900 RepID=A0AAD7SFY2_9TELE|nr:hypothetical protein AAFF_G00379040 [Aldrovandia affinis]
MWNNTANNSPPEPGPADESAQCGEQAGEGETSWLPLSHHQPSAWVGGILPGTATLPDNCTGSTARVHLDFLSFIFPFL